MKYLLIIILIGIALYYSMKWKNPAKGNKSSDKQSDPYSSSGKNYGNNSQTDSGPYKSNGSKANSSGSRTNYAKWVGGGLGWAFGGPIGGVLGFMMGSMFSGGVSSGTREYGQTQSGDFSLSLLILTAAVMKADGSVKRSELDYVKRFLENNFGSARTPQYVKMLGEILKQDLNIQDVSRQISQYMDYSSRMMLVQFLFGVAQADGNNHPTEIDMIQTIANYMGISLNDYESIKAMFVNDTGSAYKVLEVSTESSNDDIKKAYRELAKKHHPDRVAHLGENVKKAAEEKFMKLNAAYEAIKEERGMN